MRIYKAAPRLLITLATVHCLGGATAVDAQQAVGWRFAAPEAGAAWFQALDALHLASPGALPFYRTPGSPQSALARTISSGSGYEILHFVPLYYPSASPAALARALRDAAASSAVPSAPRAAFLVGVLRATLPTDALRAPLAALADALEHSQPATVSTAAIERWQHEWDRRFASALAPFLHAERLDGGMVMISAALGPEGRLFAGRPDDRSDNVAAVGTLDAPPDADVPLFALVRELCFPVVSRAADQAPALRASRADAARRSSMAAVRCGAELLDRLLPAEAAAYRDHWRHATGLSDGTDFDSLFPPDLVLAPRIRTAIARSAPRP